MTLASIGALIDKLAERGMDPSQILDVIQGMVAAEHQPRKALSNSERQAKFRAKKAAEKVEPVTKVTQKSVTASVTIEPEIVAEPEPTPYCVSNIYIPLPTVEGANAPKAVTGKSRLWSEGIPTIVALGVKEGTARGLVGKWMRDTGDDAERVLTAILQAGTAAPINPVPWITAALQARAGPIRASPGEIALERKNAAFSELFAEYQTDEPDRHRQPTADDADRFPRLSFDANQGGG